MENDTFDTK